MGEYELNNLSRLFLAFIAIMISDDKKKQLHLFHYKHITAFHLENPTNTGIKNTHCF